MPVEGLVGLEKHCISFTGTIVAVYLQDGTKCMERFGTVLIVSTGIIVSSIGPQF